MPATVPRPGVGLGQSKTFLKLVGNSLPQPQRPKPESINSGKPAAVVVAAQPGTSIKRDQCSPYSVSSCRP